MLGEPLLPLTGGALAPEARANLRAGFGRAVIDALAAAQADDPQVACSGSCLPADVETGVVILVLHEKA